MDTATTQATMDTTTEPAADITGILGGARYTVQGLGDQLADLLAAQTELASRVSPEWTVRDAAAHLIATTALYAELASGVTSPILQLTPAACARFNAARLADIGEAEPRLLAKALTATAGQFMDASGGRPASTPVAWHAGIPIDLAQLAGILAAEYVLHGFDIATALGVAWPINSEQAALGLFGRGAVLPWAADPATSHGHTASYRLDLGVAGQLTIRFDDGVLTVRGGDEAADCEISTDPTTFLLVSSGRLSQWSAIALGAYRVGGSQPDLALGFFRLIYIF